MFRKLWLPIIVTVATCVFILIMARVGFWVYMDFPSVIVVPVLSSIVPCLIFGMAGIRSAFRAPIAKTPTKLELRMSIAFFKALGASTVVFGLIGTIMATVAMLYNLADKTRVGPSMAMALLTMFNAALVWAVIVLPFSLNAKKRLAELEG